MNRKNIKAIVKAYEAYLTAEFILQEANANFDVTEVDRNQAQEAMWTAHRAWQTAQRDEEMRIVKEAREARTRRFAEETSK